MKKRPTLVLALRAAAISTLATLPVSAGDWAAEMFSSDADSGINAGLTYTAKVDYSGGTTINSVALTDTGLTGTGYALTGPDGVFTGYANTPSGNINAALSNFVYGGGGNASLQLTGLTPGAQYVTTFHSVAFGGSRFVAITPSDTGVAFTINEDGGVKGAGTAIRYAFTATAATQTYAFDAVNNGDSFHHYLMTNEVRDDALNPYTHFTPVQAMVTTATTFTPSNSDLLQTAVASSAFSANNWNHEGSAGTPSFNDGNFPAATSVLPSVGTIENNAVATYNLDVVAAPLGYDITSIAGYGVWNDAGRDLQKYSVWVSLVDSADYVLYGQVQADGQATSPTAVRSVFTGSISGVDSIRFTFVDGQENGYGGIGELDVFGTATVPEPSCALLVLGALGLANHRRRARASRA
jgi:hypothetical protein